MADAYRPPGHPLEQTHNIVKGEWCQGRFQDLGQGRIAAAIEVGSILKIRRDLRLISRYKGHEGRFAHGLEGSIHTALHTQWRAGVATQVFATQRAGAVGWVDQRLVRQEKEFVV